MAKSNLSWGTFLTYLDVLVRNDFVKVQFVGKYPTYHITTRGGTVLTHYEELRNEMSVLKLGSLSNKATRAALKSQVAGKPGGSPKARLVEMLKGEGMKVIDSSIVGKSGVTHEYDAVGRSGSGLVHVYAVVQDVNKNHVLSMHAKQLDTDALSHILYSGTVAPEALELAQSYHIELVKW